MLSGSGANLEVLRNIEVYSGLLVIKASDAMPINNSEKLTATIIKNATLKVIPEAPHGICTTHANVINQEILTFLEK